MSSSNFEGLGGEGWLCQADRVGSVWRGRRKIQEASEESVQMSEIIGADKFSKMILGKCSLGLEEADPEKIN